MMALLAQPILSSHTWDLIMKELSDREIEAAAITGAIPPRLGGGPQRASHGFRGTSQLPDRRDMNPSVGNLPPPNTSALPLDPTNIDRQKVASLIHQAIQQQRQREENAREVASTPSSRVPSDEEQRQNLPAEVFEPHRPPPRTRVIPEHVREDLMGQAGPAHGLPEIGEEEQLYPEGRVPEVPHKIKQILDAFPEGDPNTPLEVQQLRAQLQGTGTPIGRQRVGVTTSPGQTMAAKVGVRGNLFPPGVDSQGRAN